MPRSPLEGMQTGRHAPGYRRILWIGLPVSAALFGVEIATGPQSGSASWRLGGAAPGPA